MARMIVQLEDVDSILDEKTIKWMGRHIKISLAVLKKFEKKIGFGLLTEEVDFDCEISIAPDGSIFVQIEENSDYLLTADSAKLFLEVAKLEIEEQIAGYKNIERLFDKVASKTKTKTDPPPEIKLPKI